MAHSSEIEKLERRWMDNPTGLTFAPLAEAYRRAGDHPRALEVLELGLAQHAGYVPALIVQARCHLDARLSGEAETSFNAVLQSDPHNLIALKGLADICEMTERLPSAKGFLDRLLDADPTHEEAGLQRDRIADLLGRRNAMAGSPSAAEPVPSSIESDTAGDLEIELAESVESAVTADADGPEMLAVEPSLGMLELQAGSDQAGEPQAVADVATEDPSPASFEVELNPISAGEFPGEDEPSIERSGEFSLASVDGETPEPAAVAGDEDADADAEFTIERMENPFEGFDASTWDLPFGEVEVPAQPFDEDVVLETASATEAMEDGQGEDDRAAGEVVAQSGEAMAVGAAETAAAEEQTAPVEAMANEPAGSGQAEGSDAGPAVEWTPVAEATDADSEPEPETVPVLETEDASTSPQDAPEPFEAELTGDPASADEATAVDTGEPAATSAELPEASGGGPVEELPGADSPTEPGEGEVPVVAETTAEAVADSTVAVAPPTAAESAAVDPVVAEHPEPIDLRLEGEEYLEVEAGWMSSTDWSDYRPESDPDATDVVSAIPPALESETPEPAETPPLATVAESVETVAAVAAVAETAEATEEVEPDAEDAVTVVEGAFEEEPSAEASEPAPEVEPELVITETMAEVFLRQGHRPLALAVYAQLLERDPGNQRLVDAVSRLRGELLDQRSPDTPTQSQAQGEPEEPIGSFLARVLGPEPETVVPTPSDSEPQYTGPLSGRPTRAAEDPLFSLNTIFGEDTRRQPAARPGMATGVDEAEPSFDEFFGEAGVPAGAGGDEAELEQFNAWLRSLQR